MQKKHNQALRRYAYKNDDQDLINIANCIREKFPNVSIKREWYIVFDSQCNFVMAQKNVPVAGIYRCPDLMIFDSKYIDEKETIREKPILAFELDGGVHDVKWNKTQFRNKQYSDAKVPLVVTNKGEINTSIYDDALLKVSEYL